MQNLRFFRFWILIGILLVVLVFYLSLTSKPPKIVTFQFGDKVGHLLAYSTLMFWFGQLFVQRNYQIACFVFFLTMGLGLEVLQGMGGHRYFEWADMLANGLGVLLGWLLARFVLKDLFLKLEQRLVA